MYDGRFLKAKDFNGKYYRNHKTGSLINFCLHSWHIYPIFVEIEEYHAQVISENSKRLKNFTGICYFCGEVIIIPRENIFSNEEEFQKSLKERLKEIEE